MWLVEVVALVDAVVFIQCRLQTSKGEREREEGREGSEGEGGSHTDSHVILSKSSSFVGTNY